MKSLERREREHKFCKLNETAESLDWRGPGRALIVNVGGRTTAHSH